MSELALQMRLVILADCHEAEGLGPVLVDGNAPKVREGQQAGTGILEHCRHFDVAWRKKEENDFSTATATEAKETKLGRVVTALQADFSCP